MKIEILNEHLFKEKRCPVCGAGLFRGKKSFGGMRRFECGAVFAVSALAEVIVAADPCPVGSNVQASILTTEALAGKVVAA
jgi:ribosomal protein S27AE